MSLYSIAEVLVYELVGLLPNLLLALVPFRKNLRLSLPKTGFFILLLYSMASVSRILSLKGLPVATFLNILWSALYLAFYILSMRLSVSRLLFILLILMNFGSFVTVLFSYLTYHRFPVEKDYIYSFHSSLVIGLIYLVCFPFLYWMIDKKIRPLMEDAGDNRFWRYLFMVPGTFCLSYYYNLIANGGFIAFSAKLSNTLFAVFFNFGALFVTYLTICLLQESNSCLRLKSENYLLNMQSIQYDNLKVRIEDARRSRHDLRQILTVLHYYIQDSDIEGMRAYIHRYIDSTSVNSPVLYCENYALNAVIAYYGNLSQESGIRFDAQVDYPRDSLIPDTDTVVLIGNLLENSVEACKRNLTADAYISFRMKIMQENIIITVDNTYNGTIRRIKNTFYSSKSGSPGIGTASIQNIVEKYHGVIRFDYDEAVFHVSILLTYEHEHQGVRETSGQFDLLTK